jgi:hypothetical protein
LETKDAKSINKRLSELLVGYTRDSQGSHRPSARYSKAWQFKGVNQIQGPKKIQKKKKMQYILVLSLIVASNAFSGFIPSFGTRGEFERYEIDQ